MVKVNEIDACLPQTQCTECGYDGCLPYAEAILTGQDSIDKCPPGGTKTLKQLASLLKLDPTPYLKTVSENTRAPSLAVIDEAECIGCTKCIQACPVDAIIGSSKQMHAVITHDCTGCTLCVEPCPVDCIEMVELEQSQYQPERARRNYHQRQARLLRKSQQQKQRYLAKRRLAQAENKQQDTHAKQAYILKALERVKRKTEET